MKNFDDILINLSAEISYSNMMWLLSTIICIERFSNRLFCWNSLLHSFVTDLSHRLCISKSTEYGLLIDSFKKCSFIYNDGRPLRLSPTRINFLTLDSQIRCYFSLYLCSNTNFTSNLMNIFTLHGKISWKGILWLSVFCAELKQKL